MKNRNNLFGEKRRRKSSAEHGLFSLSLLSLSNVEQTHATAIRHGKSACDTIRIYTHHLLIRSCSGVKPVAICQSGAGQLGQHRQPSVQAF